MATSLVDRLRERVRLLTGDHRDMDLRLLQDAAAEIERLQRVIARIETICFERRNDCTALTSNPPQNAVAHYVGTLCKLALEIGK
jgi:hypothetical protein